MSLKEKIENLKKTPKKEIAATIPDAGNDSGLLEFCAGFALIVLAFLFGRRK